MINKEKMFVCNETRKKTRKEDEGMKSKSDNVGYRFLKMYKKEIECFQFVIQLPF